MSRDKLRLSSAQLAVGRFFFVHAARAAHDDQVPRTYEFLHATFGEYLVARLVHRLSLEVLAKERAATSLYGRQDGTGWLEPVLSFTPLTTRTPVVAFLRELFAETPETDRTDLHELFTALVVTAQHRPPGADHPDYLPRALPIAGRIAAFTANLVILAVVVRGRVTATDLHPTGWHPGVAVAVAARRGGVGQAARRAGGRAWSGRRSGDHFGGPPGRPAASAGRHGVVDRHRSGGPGLLVLPSLLDEFRRWENFRPSWVGGHAAAQP